MMRHNLIDVIMQTTDLRKLAAMYDIATIKEEKIKTVETLIEKPRKEIPVAEIKKGVTLEEIRNAQEISNITYEEIEKMVAEEEWEQSIEELLELLD